jgi:hypothetical protein
MTKWIIEVEGGPGICPNGATIIRQAAYKHSGENQATLFRLATALDSARDAGEIEALEIQAADHHRDEMEELAAEILNAFTKGSDGYRARVGQVQIGKWRAILDGGQ